MDSRIPILLQRFVQQDQPIGSSYNVQGWYPDRRTSMNELVRLRSHRFSAHDTIIAGIIQDAYRLYPGTISPLSWSQLLSASLPNTYSLAVRNNNIHSLKNLVYVMSQSIFIFNPFWCFELALLASLTDNYLYSKTLDFCWLRCRSYKANRVSFSQEFTKQSEVYTHLSIAPSELREAFASWSGKYPDIINYR